MEAAALLDGEPIKDIEGMKSAAAKLQAQGPEYVLIKGGHLEGVCIISISLVMHLDFVSSFLLACQKVNSMYCLLEKLIALE